MVTIFLRSSTTKMCAPVSVNSFIKLIRTNPPNEECFWPRLLQDKEDNLDDKVAVRIDNDNLEYLKGLKRIIKKSFGITVSYSLLVKALYKYYQNPREFKVMSLNVKGYKAYSVELSERLKEITKEIKSVLPDLVLLQEFRTGEQNMFLKILMKELGKYYEPIFPKGFKEQEEFNFCICMILIPKNIARIRAMSFQNGTAFRLRYNLIEIRGISILNAWIPQVFNPQAEIPKFAEDMWNAIIESAQYYHDKKKSFYLMGDLNSYKSGPFEDRIFRLNMLLIDTKKVDDICKPTGQTNILDYAFANRHAFMEDNAKTTIYEPSIKERDLSDHDALLMVLKLPVKVTL